VKVKRKRNHDAEDLAEIEAADRALAEADERIPYEVVRKELGLQ
jgi:hypothetical protein